MLEKGDSETRFFLRKPKEFGAEKEEENRGKGETMDGITALNYQVRGGKQIIRETDWKKHRI